MNSFHDFFKIFNEESNQGIYSYNAGILLVSYVSSMGITWNILKLLCIKPWRFPFSVSSFLTYILKTDFLALTIDLFRSSLQPIKFPIDVIKCDNHIFIFILFIFTCYVFIFLKIRPTGRYGHCRVTERILVVLQFPIRCQYEGKPCQLVFLSKFLVIFAYSLLPMAHLFLLQNGYW